MKSELSSRIEAVLQKLGITGGLFRLEYPENPEHGDFSCNAAMVNAKQLGMAPKALAEKIVAGFQVDMPEFVESVEVAGPGFINFKIKDAFFAEHAVSVSNNKEYGWGGEGKGRKVMVEYTDPNPFKVFHIGHLMANAIGESISRLIEGSGAKVVRACYQGDVGLHVAKTIWAIQKKGATAEGTSVTEKVQWLGDMYVYGSQFDDDIVAQKEIAAVNKKIFEKSDSEINSIYEEGRKWSLEYFGLMYTRLGTKFDQFFFESEVAEDGLNIVREFLKKGVFAESEGAVVFKGEDHGVHTRVFITSHGLPTYEAKELGLNSEKFKKYPDLTESIIITANEQNDYFKVLLKAFSLMDPNISDKTRHISHGILRFASGKMSSRKGNIVSADSLIEDVRKLVVEKIADRQLSAEEKEIIADQVAIGAIKYTILRQSVGSDVIFDSSASISFEGDSGPYLQYAVVRAHSILNKGKSRKVSTMPEQVTLLEKLISRFPDIVERARSEYAPQQIAGYLLALAGAFNGYYAAHTIIDEKDPLSPYRLALTQSFATTMTNGLWLLGITVPEKM